MNGGAATNERARAIDGMARLRLVDGPLLRPVLCRVVSMMLARADWPLDRLEEALLVCDTLCAHAPRNGHEQCLTFSIEAGEHEAELCICELSPQDAEQLLSDAHLPLVGNVLEQLAERVAVERDGESGARLAIGLNSE